MCEVEHWRVLVLVKTIYFQNFLRKQDFFFFGKFFSFIVIYFHTRSPFLEYTIFWQRRNDLPIVNIPYITCCQLAAFPSCSISHQLFIMAAVSFFNWYHYTRLIYFNCCLVSKSQTAFSSTLLIY